MFLKVLNILAISILVLRMVFHKDFPNSIKQQEFKLLKVTYWMPFICLRICSDYILLDVIFHHKTALDNTKSKVQCLDV